MTFEVNANVLAQPREPFWMDEYPEAYVYAGYNAGDHDNKYHTGGQTVVGQTVMDMEVRANIQRVYSDSDSTACVYATAAGDPLTNPDRYMTTPLCRSQLPIIPCTIMLRWTPAAALPSSDNRCLKIVVLLR